MSDEIKVQDKVSIFQDGNKSNEIGLFTTNNTRSNENIGKSKKERDSSLNVNNKIYNQSIRRDASAKIKKTNRVYNAQKNRIIILEDIEKAISENRYNKKETTSNLIISSEENKDNIKTNRDAHENVILTEAISNITKDNEEIKEEN